MAVFRRVVYYSLLGTKFHWIMFITIGGLLSFRWCIFLRIFSISLLSNTVPISVYLLLQLDRSIYSQIETSTMTRLFINSKMSYFKLYQSYCVIIHVLIVEIGRRVGKECRNLVRISESMDSMLFKEYINEQRIIRFENNI